MKLLLMIVDDDESIRTQMKWALADEYRVVLADSRASAMEAALREAPDVVVLDLGLPPEPGSTVEGFHALSELLEQCPMTKVIVITGQGEKENALKAIAAGAYDFLTKPIDLEELRIILKRACYVAGLERENREMQRSLASAGFEGMLGASSQMQGVFAMIRKLATTDAPVLILGESGTGKELAAQAIHSLGRRKEGPFVAINCGAIPEMLLESELFGHEKGSFTGAHAQRKGRIEAADGGTVLLDEIGDLPAALQVNLLRFLQDKRIVRVGGRTEIEIDARVIAATNTDIRKAISEERFREDLYFRLAVVTITMPPLRERVGDIPVLAKAFLARFAAECGKKLTGFAPQALRALEAYNWPGNIREMENRIKRALIMAEGRHVTAADLELEPAQVGYAGRSLKEAREALEKEIITRALAKNRGKISAVAEELGISRPTLYDLMDKLGVKRE